MFAGGEEVVGVEEGEEVADLVEVVVMVEVVAMVEAGMEAAVGVIVVGEAEGWVVGGAVGAILTTIITLCL